MSEKTCTRCGASVPSILSGPPAGQDSWWRNQIVMGRREVHHVLRFRMFRLRWLPANPWDQLRETHTTLDLCDDCARAVFMFAQGMACREVPEALKTRDLLAGAIIEGLPGVRLSWSEAQQAADTILASRPPGAPT